MRRREKMPYSVIEVRIDIDEWSDDAMSFVSDSSLSPLGLDAVPGYDVLDDGNSTYSAGGSTFSLASGWRSVFEAALDEGDDFPMEFDD
eukprot:630637-Pyramimonas_sp.AAC.1